MKRRYRASISPSTARALIRRDFKPDRLTGKGALLMRAPLAFYGVTNAPGLATQRKVDMKNSREKTRLVVVGNGMASSAFLDELVRADPERFEITVFGKERHPNYNRVLLSQLLTGEKTLKEILLHEPEWYGRAGISLRTGVKVAAIKRGSRAVVLDDGGEVSYDRLVLATGSVPVMPKIPGVEKEGVVSFRDIDDCVKIRTLSSNSSKAVVLGGGLLGLEAAWGLKRLGMDVTVVHLAERLMERQLDPAAASFLKEDIERLGIRVLLESEAVEFVGGPRLEGVRFRDGGSVEAGVAVVSIGIRPNIELAAASGIYTQRGVVVSDTMQTYDPAVWALGECVEHRGATFGLVAPLFEQAAVLANHLAGDCRLVFTRKPVSARLKVPGIELYSAGDTGDESGKETVEYIDRNERVYKKLVIRDNRIEGIIMYGECSAGPSLFTALLERSDVSGRRQSLLSVEALSPSGPSAPMPDSAIVCGCNGVTAGTIRGAIEKKGLFTREDVARETKASSSCGGCSSVVDRLLEETLGSNFHPASGPRSICGCTIYTRDDVIKNIRERRLMTVGAVMETLGWETVGCERCRPAINYYLSMVWPGEAEDDQTSRLVNERLHANVQRDGTFSVVPRMWGGATTPEELKRIADAALKYSVPLVKLTGGQRIALLGVKKDDLPGVWRDLGMPSGYAYGKALRTVKTCVGSGYCRYGTQDSLGAGIEIEKRFNGVWTPAKVKMSVAGCPRNCAESAIKDIGVVGVVGGWEVYAGGCAGIELKRAGKLASVRTLEEVVEVAGALLQYYREDAEYGERMYKWIVRRSLDEIKRAVVDDLETRRALFVRLGVATKRVSDPWKERAGKVTVERASV